MSSYFRTLGPRLLAQGYTIVPIPRGSKGPRLDDWRNLQLQASTFEEWCKGTWTKVTADGERQIPNSRDTDGVGINTTRNPAVDVDDYDESIVKQVRAFMEDNLDAVGPLRIGKAPKSLFLFRTDTPFAKLQSSTWKDSKGRACKCEILGDGQQFVAYHIHPDTLKPYVWPDEWASPIDVAAADLPVLTEVAAKAICSFYDKLCSEAGRSKVSDASSGGDDSGEALAREAPPPETEYEIARVKKALDHISPDCSRSEYLAVLAGLKWTGWMCSEEIAHEWAEKSEEGKFDERDFQRDWRSLEGERIGKRTTTLGSVISMAVKAGFDASRKDEVKLTPEEAKTLFSGLSDRIGEITPNDRDAVKTLVKDIGESGLDAIDTSALLKMLSKASKVSIADLRRAAHETKAVEKRKKEGAPTHSNYAARLLAIYEKESGEKPVCVADRLWVFDDMSGIWQGKPLVEVEQDVAEHFDEQENVTTVNAYISIAKHAMGRASLGKEEFFDNAPVGMACEGRFLHVEEDHIKNVSLKAEHRQQVAVAVVPQEIETPLWDKLMNDALPEEEGAAQRSLLEEFVGGALIGVTQNMERVLLLKGVTRSGKSTVAKIIQALVPTKYRTEVLPDKWDREYELSALAYSRLNMCGELPDDKPIQGAAFKTVVGRDRLMARKPYGVPFSFTCRAAHIFNSNHFPTTQDHSDAFFNKWIVVSFNHSMEDRDPSEMDVNLAVKIIESELPGVAWKFLDGARRLIKRKRFELTATHHAQIATWQHKASTLLDFLTDTGTVVLRADLKTKRQLVWQAYTAWCNMAQRRPMGRNKFFDELRTSRKVRSLGITEVLVGTGNGVLKGMALRSEGFDVEWDEDEY